MIQRAELLNLVLTDLYGPRQLLRRGVLPAELVLGHAGFLRQCDQIRLPGSQQLFTFAVDLARDAVGPLYGAGRLHPGAVGSRATPWRTGSSSPGCSRACTATPRCTGSPPSSVPCGPPSRASPRPTPTIRASSC